MLVEQSVVCPVLIGRDAPLSAGLHALDRARASHGSTLLISGEAGIGKSRLTRAIVERARELGFVTLPAACFEADRSHPYAPLLDMVRVLSATTSASLASHYFAPAATELVTLFPELRPLFPDATPRPAVDPEEDRRRLFHSFGNAIQALAGVQPLVLVIEDVHWSDDATLDLLLHLARHIATLPIAIVLTFRSDEVGPRLSRLLADFDRARVASEVALRPLSVGEVTAMLQTIFGTQQTLGPGFVEALHSLTEGNPFFVEEMLKALLVAGDLVRADGTWRARPLDHVRVPRTATEAVGRRLAGLSAEARAVASIAAVAGRRFDFGLLQTLTKHDEVALLSLVKELVEAQLVVEETADRFAFRHALTREAMRARLLARERVALHKAIAAALEANPETHDDDDALSYHLYEAGAWDAARHYAQRAAARAMSLSAAREALQHYDRAVSATLQSGERPDPELLVARGRAHELLGAFSHANDDFGAALTAARERQDQRAEWMALHALGLLWSARDYERAGEYRREALEVARAIGDPSLIARALNRVGNWFVNREDPRSGIPYHDEALAIFEQVGDQRGITETVDLLAMAHHIAGTQDSAVRLYERAVDLFTAADDRRGLTNALSVLALSGPSQAASAGPIGLSGLYESLLETERPIRLATEIGWRAGEAFSRFLIADCLSWRGEYARALRLARESLSISLELEHLEWQCGARRVIGATALDLGHSADAISYMQAAHDIARQLGSATWIRWTAAPLIIALARAGEVRRAIDALADVDRIVPRVASGPDRPQTLGERFLQLARGEIALAQGATDDVLTLFSERDLTGCPRASVLCAQAHMARDQWDDARAALGRARTDAVTQGARPLVWRIDALVGATWLGQRQRLEARRAYDAARTEASSLVDGLAEPSYLDSFTALLDTLAPPPPKPTEAKSAKAAHGGLTKRERDTAALIAQGKSNRAIAKQLGIGERTVEGYVASALGKLGFSSRTQIAAWATEQGLQIQDTVCERHRR
ncbi:MAG: AAA family ATPase [Gemmatimonadaceae bacterium]